MATTTVSENRSEGRMPQRFRLGHRFRAGPGALSRPGGLCPAALGSTGRSTAAGHGQLSRRARGHGLRGLHGPDGRGRFRRAAGPRLGLPGQGQLQGRGAGQEGGRALRDRPAHLPGGAEAGRGQPGVGGGPASSGSTRTSQRAEQLVAHRRDHPGRVRQDRRRPRRSGRRRSAALKAAVERAQLDLGFTKVTAPVSGRVSRYHRHRGQPGSGGRPDRRHPAHHDRVGGPDVRLLRRGRAHGAARQAVDPRRQGQVARRRRHPRVARPGQRGRVTPTRGPSTSSTTRSTPRPAPCGCGACSPTRTRRSSPGYFARVRVPIGRPHKALLVTDRALDTDQGQKIVYVVDEDNEVVSRPVRLGALHDGLREITDGLKPGERVIVNGLQQVRPGMTVEPNLVDMPTSKVGRRRSDDARRRSRLTRAHRSPSRSRARPKGELSCWPVSSSTARSWPRCSRS